ncbi:MAG: excinuclease ABC subunit UvrC [Treponemataceae bacterium]|nr:excinuclease ABC subunit UvrC [Spirochaetales bacterium]MDY6031819.1 excinuclease ABC subunit UvrC [Treponemataceae bacterium]
MNDNPLYNKLHETALNAPKLPGVYLWRDENQTVIYVGKAKVLKNRLSSYFSGKKDIKTRTLISRAVSIEYITTDNEYEALILENNLIKKYSPRYNIDLKDDKSYPMLRITNEDFPRIFSTRRLIEDGSLYFGPYPNAGSLATFIEDLHKNYKLRHCKKFRTRNSPCMYYHIGRCDAPCCKKIDKQSYNEIIDEIKSFLEGNPEETVEKLRAQMKEEAKKLNFEKAARLRDGIDAILSLHSKNTVMDFNTDSRDYIAFASEGTMVSFSVLKMRDGKLVMRDLHRTKSLNEDKDLMMEFLMAYYANSDSLPQKIFIPVDIDKKLFLKYISTNFKITPEVTVIAVGNTSRKPEAAGGDTADTTDVKNRPDALHISAMNMAKQNAIEDIVRRERERTDVPALTELKNLLGLDHLPARIEGFDIAHIGGKMPVASLISFYNGNPDKKNYRYFRLKTTEGIIDDFASMREASSRRYTRLLNDNKPLPDLILIDGGIGQVNAVQGVLESLDLDIPIIGLAKRDEEIYLPHNSTPITLPKRSDALRLLQRVRDETHRFATSRNQNLRTKSNTVGDFPKLPHIGAKRAALLMANYGSIEGLVSGVQNDGILKLSQIACISENQAAEVYQAAQIMLKND